MHPSDVAFERVDLAVVRDVAIRVRELPAWKSVRGKPLVHQAQRALGIGIGKISVEVGNLGREQQTFVNDGATRQRGNVEKFFVFDVRLGYLEFSPLANQVQLPFESLLIHLSWARDKDLLDVRLRSPRNPSNSVPVYGSVAPAQNTESFFANNSFEDAFAIQPRMFLNRQKSHANCVFAGCRQREAQDFAFAGEELVGNLNEHSGAVA